MKCEKQRAQINFNKCDEKDGKEKRKKIVIMEILCLRLVRKLTNPREINALSHHNEGKQTKWKMNECYDGNFKFFQRAALRDRKKI